MSGWEVRTRNPRLLHLAAVVSLNNTPNTPSSRSSSRSWEAGPTSAQTRRTVLMRLCWWKADHGNPGGGSQGKDLMWAHRSKACKSQIPSLNQVSTYKLGQMNTSSSTHQVPWNGTRIMRRHVAKIGLHNILVSLVILNCCEYVYAVLSITINAWGNSISPWN